MKPWYAIRPCLLKTSLQYEISYLDQLKGNKEVQKRETLQLRGLRELRRYKIQLPLSTTCNSFEFEIYMMVVLFIPFSNMFHVRYKLFRFAYG